MSKPSADEWYRRLFQADLEMWEVALRRTPQIGRIFRGDIEGAIRLPLATRASSDCPKTGMCITRFLRS